MSSEYDPYRPPAQPGAENVDPDHTQLIPPTDAATSAEPGAAATPPYPAPPTDPSAHETQVFQAPAFGAATAPDADPQGTRRYEPVPPTPGYGQSPYTPPAAQQQAPTQPGSYAPPAYGQPGHDQPGYGQYTQPGYPQPGYSQAPAYGSGYGQPPAYGQPEYGQPPQAYGDAYGQGAAPAGYAQPGAYNQPQGQPQAYGQYGAGQYAASQYGSSTYPQGSYAPGQYPPGGYAPGAATDAQPTKSRRTLYILVAALVIVVAVVGGLFATKPSFLFHKVLDPKAVAKAIQSDTTAGFTGVTCPSNEKVEKGTTFTCTADGDRKITITINDSAGNYTWAPAS